MTCYHPIPGFRTPNGVVFSELRRHDVLGAIEIPCGQCLGCRLRRARDWSIRVMHEAQCYDYNCFVTLTYAPGHLPPNGFLHYPDFQGFMKRLRRYSSSQASLVLQRKTNEVRFFMCGEYGPLNLRPHYHACFFNLEFPDKVPAGKSAAGAVFYDSPILRSLWGLGNVSVQPLTVETAAYCARYVVDKVTGDAAKQHYRTVDPDGVVHQRPAEFSRCSLKPGIGARWFERYGSDTYRFDSVVMEGTEHQVPRYYDKLLRRAISSNRVGPSRSSLAGSGVRDRVEFARYERAVASAPDNTPERREAREVVHKARVRNQKRDSL